MEEAGERLDLILHQTIGPNGPNGGLGGPKAPKPTEQGQVGALTLLGLFGSMDPARPGVREAVMECKGAGVRVIMITGDQKPTACAIARGIQILEHGDSIEDCAAVCSELHED